MKRIFGLFVVLSTFSSAAYAQSTMPAMGANTPKGEVAKTDASLNQTNAAERNNATTKSTKSSGKQMRKPKTPKSKSTTTSPM